MRKLAALVLLMAVGARCAAAASGQNTGQLYDLAHQPADPRAGYGSRLVAAAINRRLCRERMFKPEDGRLEHCWGADDGRDAIYCDVRVRG